MRKLLLVALSLAACGVSLAACGGEPPPQPEVAPPPTTPATPEPPAASAAPTASASAAASGSPAASKAPSGPLKWADFPGPKVAPATKGPKAWIVGPIQNSSWTEFLAVFYVDVVKVEGNELVVKGVKGDVFVPGAFVSAPKEQKALKKGAPVFGQDETSGMIVGARYGRISEVTKNGDSVSYKVDSMFAGQVSDEEYTPQAIVPLDGKATFGAPIAWKDGEKWNTGTFVSAGADAGSAWAITSSGPKQVKGAKPLTVNKVFKKGDKVWAVKYGELKPGTVTEVLAGGAAYKVKFPKDGGIEESESSVSMSEVTSPL